MNSVKGIIFDYGGTIDTNGTHWGEVIWEQYKSTGVTNDNALFRDAYVHGERTLAKSPIIEPGDTFHTLLEKKIRIQAAWLRENGCPVTAEQETAIVEGCYKKVTDTLQTTLGVIEKIAARYPLVLVTNFYGNMPVVLKEFGLDKYFPTIVESSVVGLRKPNPALFALGVEALHLPAREILVVGDSYSKDIYPARTLGCKAVWIKNICWAPEDVKPNATPTAIIKSLEELPALLAL